MTFPQKKTFVSSFDVCSYCSRVAASFVDEVSTSVKIQLGVRSQNNVSSINLFFIAFLNVAKYHLGKVKLERAG